VLLDRVHGADAGVVERRGRARLALEAFENRRIALHSSERNFTATRRPSRVSSAS
jgi:hypothetical protein